MSTPFPALNINVFSNDGSLLVNWSDNVLTDPRGPNLAGFVRRPGRGTEMLLRLRAADGHERLLTLPVRLGSPLPPIWPSQAPAAWGLTQVVPGAWRLSPSIVEEGIHAMITVIGTPEPPFVEEAAP